MTADGPVCPIPIDRYPRVTMAHGGGGRLMNELIERMLLAALGNEHTAARHDGAVLPTEAKAIAVTTDSFVVTPLAFPGGSIGSLCVYGTANDLAMCGARPQYLTLSLILEEGLPMETLWREVQAIRRACDEVGLAVVTGDTKVVERGKGDGMFVNTTGVGRVLAGAAIRPSAVVPGDAIVVSGDLGRHGMAVMAARDDLALDTPLVSDCGNLVAAALALIEAGLDVHCLRDLTRGGLVSALNEVAQTAGVSMTVAEDDLAVDPAVASACELLGLDPLYVANEGRFAAWLPADQTDRALTILRTHPITADAVVAGRVDAVGPRPQVVATNAYGTQRLLDALSGEQLPRIC